MSQTKFLLNNIGAVFTMRLPSMTFPNVNFGFSYNKAVLIQQGLWRKHTKVIQFFE